VAKFKESPAVLEKNLELEQARQHLYDLSEEYGNADVTEKAAKKVKEENKPLMLGLMTEIVREEIPLATELVTVTDAEAARFDFEWKDWCAVNYPGWRVSALAPEEGQTVVTIEEDETFKKFEFVYEGKKYGRTVAMVGAEFDAAGFLAWLEEYSEDAGISEEAFDAAFNSVELETVIKFTLDESAAEKVIADYPELLPIYQQHSSPGTPQVRLIPIKTVKEEEV